MLRKKINDNKILYRKYLYILCLSLIGVLSGCAATKEVHKDDPMPEICEQELRNCFGEDYLLSEGVDKEDHFFEEHKQTEIITYYTEWELTYQDAYGQDRVFTLNNYYYGNWQPSERIDGFIKNYFSDLVEEHYKQRFWNKMIAEMPGCREDSVLYFEKYRIFSNPNVPETSVMHDERVNYSLTENVYFPRLKYTDVCINFPYIFNLYLNVDYVSNDETKRKEQRRDTEKRLRETMDAMIQYTGESLNAKAYVIMMDENGFADDFTIAVLKGDYFESGYGIEYEKALHENFFGPIEIE